MQLTIYIYTSQVYISTCLCVQYGYIAGANMHHLDSSYIAVYLKVQLIGVHIYTLASYIQLHSQLCIATLMLCYMATKTTFCKKLKQSGNYIAIAIAIASKRYIRQLALSGFSYNHIAIQVGSQLAIQLFSVLENK